ncbi:MAG: hypothetical protein FVQ84_06260 [Planctomycetes bacterium]|nr:hypothetical protein [Planctomycetota bacterium]
MASKIRNNEAKTDRQTKILLITVSLVLVQLSGCSPAPSSPLTQIEREPPGFPQIRLDENTCPSQRLYNFLKQNSKGKIGPHANADYIITRLDLDSEIDMGFQKASYRLYCEVSDNYNKTVIQTVTNRIVKGRFEPGTDYRDTVSTRKYEEFIAKDAAIQLMNDLYKKIPAVVAAQP